MDKKEIPVRELKLGMYVTELDRPWLGTPFLFQGFPITSADQIDEVKKHCETVFIDLERDASGIDPRGYAGNQVVRGTVVYKQLTQVEEELVVAKEVYSACEESVQSSIESIRATGELDSKPLTNAVGNMSGSIKRNPDAMMLLFRIKKKGGEELNRAVDTSIHMISFGRFLQFPGERLELLGLAGLLLDIGKVKLPDAILHKKDTLTTEEYKLTKAHVMQSIELIRAAPGLPKGLEEIVLQHHERQDGSGYPRGLRGRQITIDGAIAGLVNSYSAITSRRTYAEQAAPSNALSMLYKLRGKLFHDALVEQFIQCIGIYPVGSTVELNTGEVGIVIAQNLVRRLQPRVMLVLDRSWKPIRSQVILDLIKEPKATQDEPYRIRRTLPRDKLPIDPEEFFLQITG
jgi:HD-GYP domain-containing protein (c-di-GMP phosphodiesterase class II)